MNLCEVTQGVGGVCRCVAVCHVLLFFKFFFFKSVIITVLWTLLWIPSRGFFASLAANVLHLEGFLIIFRFYYHFYLEMLCVMWIARVFREMHNVLSCCVCYNHRAVKEIFAVEILLQTVHLTVDRKLKDEETLPTNYSNSSNHVEFDCRNSDNHYCF